MEKAQTRMVRHLKSTSQQAAVVSGRPQGCWDDYATNKTPPKQLDLFKISQIGTRPSIPPAFVVPAIIDALRANPQYASFIKLVPGEADMYCAKMATDNGSIVFTSDSDLLAHDLKNGQVALFRDITMQDGHVQAATFSPSEISQRLGIGSPTRLAYERRNDKDKATDAIIRACKTPAVDMKEYESFSQQYIFDGTMDAALAKLDSLKFCHLDPRLSEVILQLTQSSADAKAFLPVLMENPDRGSAWEPSSPIRQLAYSIAALAIPSHAKAVQEYRRVHSFSQKGRRIEMLDKAAVLEAATTLIAASTTFRRFAGKDSSLFWLSLCLGLDIIECTVQGKYTHALQMLQTQRDKPLRTTNGVPWDIVHLTAQLHAALYSLRMLKQVLDISGKSTHAILGTHASPVRELLKGLPSLAEYPDAHGTIAFMTAAIGKGIFTTLDAAGYIPAEPKPVNKRRNESSAKDTRKKAKQDTGRSKSTNPFDLLGMDEA